MKTKDKFLFVSLGILAAGTIVLCHRLEQHEQADRHRARDVAQKTERTLEKRAIVVKERSYHEVLNKLRFEPPTLSTIREEVEKNPHSTPVSLMRFSSEIASWIVASKRSTELAEIFLERLNDCALDRYSEGLPVAAVALCYRTARSLSEYHPHLRGSFLKLEDGTSEKAKQLLALAESVGSRSPAQK